MVKEHPSPLNSNSSTNAIKNMKKYGLTPLASIGILNFAMRIFFDVESQYFNSFIQNVINLPAIYVAYMVNCSAIMGCIVSIIIGAVSDSRPNGKWERKRPFALAGIIAGIFMILVPFQTDYWLVFFMAIFLITSFGNTAGVSMLLYLSQEVVYAFQVLY